MQHLLYNILPDQVLQLSPTLLVLHRSPAFAVWVVEDLLQKSLPWLCSLLNTTWWDLLGKLHCAATPNVSSNLTVFPAKKTASLSSLHCCLCCCVVLHVFVLKNMTCRIRDVTPRDARRKQKHIFSLRKMPKIIVTLISLLITEKKWSD